MEAFTCTSKYVKLSFLATENSTTSMKQFGLLIESFEDSKEKRRQAINLHIYLCTS